MSRCWNASRTSSNDASCCGMGTEMSGRGSAVDGVLGVLGIL